MSAPQPGSDRIKPNPLNTPCTTGVPATSANDSLGQVRSKRRVTAADVAALDGSLAKRARACLMDIAKLGTATGRQLERLHYEATESGRRLARIELKNLTEDQGLQRLTRRVGGVRGGSRGYVYALGVAGQRLAFPGKRRYRAPWTPKPSYLRHALTVSELYVRMREAERVGHLELAAYDAEPACWRSFVGPGGARVTLKPDAYAVVYRGAVEDRYFVEVDLGTEDGSRILTKLKSYIAYWRSGREQEREGLFPLTCWVATTTERARFLAEIIERLPEADQSLFTVAERDEFIERVVLDAMPERGEAIR